MKDSIFWLKIVLLGIICGFLLSCDGKRKELSEVAVKEFFIAVKNENEGKMKDLYPDFSKIGAYYKSDEILIKEVIALEEKRVQVTIENAFTNGFGKKFNQTITLWLKPIDETGEIYKIYDTKGLNDFEGKDEFKFAVKTGCIENSQELTDQEIADKLATASQMIINYSMDVMSELREKVKVTKWSWENGYGNYANGQGIVKNNSDYDIPELKYKITYFDSRSNQITTDDGYVSYDKIRAGDSKSFTFFSSYVGNAYSARIELDFDIETVLKYIVSKEYTGNECSEFLKKQSKS